MITLELCKHDFRDFMHYLTPGLPASQRNYMLKVYKRLGHLTLQGKQYKATRRAKCEYGHNYSFST